MKFDDITMAIRQAWDFIFPPLLFLTLAVLGFAWLSRGSNKGLPNRNKLLFDLRTRSASMRKLAETYGLTKALPLVGLFGALMALYIWSIFFRFLSVSVPVRIMISPTKMRASAVSGEVVSQWHQATRTQPDLTLDQYFEAQLSGAKAVTTARWQERLRSIEQWNQETGVTTRQLEETKSYFVLFTVLAIYAWRRGVKGHWVLARWSVIAACLLAYGVWNAGSYLYASHQKLLAEDTLVRDYAQSLPPVKVDPETKPARTDIPRPTRWWHVELALSYEGRWIYDELTGNHGN